MSEDLSLPIAPPSSSINTGGGKSLTLDLSESAVDSYSLIFPPANGAGFLENDGDGNLSWGAGGGGVSEPLTLTQPIKLSNGTVSAPALAFANDTNTGIYRSGADTLEIMTGGVNSLSINNINSTFSNKVIIPLGDSASPSLTLSTGVTGISGSDTKISLSVSGIEQIAINDDGGGAYSLTCNPPLLGKALALSDASTSSTGGMSKDNYKITVTGGSAVVLELPAIADLYSQSQTFVISNITANNVTINVASGSTNTINPLGNTSLTLLPSTTFIFTLGVTNSWNYFVNNNSNFVNYVVNVSGNSTLGTSQNVIRITASGIITLPATNPIGREFTFVRDFAGGLFVISPNGSTINGSGAASGPASTRYAKRRLLYTAGGWIVI